MTLEPAAFYSARMEDELQKLEEKILALIARIEALREANGELGRELAFAREHNRALTQRMRAASDRLDALISRLPEETTGR